MKAEDINSYDDIYIYLEGCLNDFKSGISTNEETIGYIIDLVTHIIKKL